MGIPILLKRSLYRDGSQCLDCLTRFVIQTSVLSRTSGSLGKMVGRLCARRMGSMFDTPGAQFHSEPVRVLLPLHSCTHSFCGSTQSKNFIKKHNSICLPKICITIWPWPSWSNFQGSNYMNVWFLYQSKYNHQSIYKDQLWLTQFRSEESLSCSAKLDNTVLRGGGTHLHLWEAFTSICESGGTHIWCIY